eukprot:1223739-Pleurochrysis_carterae.AAC.1
MKHAFEVPQLLHDPVPTSAMRTAQLDFNVVAKNSFLCLRLWCSEKKQIKEFDELCRYMTEWYLSKYVSSTCANSCESFSGFVEAHEVTKVFTKLIIAIELYLQPGTPAAAPASSSTRAPARRPGLRSNTTLNACDSIDASAEPMEFGDGPIDGRGWHAFGSAAK